MESPEQSLGPQSEVTLNKPEYHYLLLKLKGSTFFTHSLMTLGSWYDTNNPTQEGAIELYI
jgi:hypothetical protein